MANLEPVVRRRSGHRRRGQLKAHRTAASLRRGVVRTKGGLNSELPKVSASQGRPLSVFLLIGQTSDARSTLGLLAEMSASKYILVEQATIRPT